jgi:hypothetical protein
MKYPFRGITDRYSGALGSLLIILLRNFDRKETAPYTEGCFSLLAGTGYGLQTKGLL